MGTKCHWSTGHAAVILPISNTAAVKCVKLTKTHKKTLKQDFKLEKGSTNKAKEPDPGGSDQQNLGYKKLKNRKTDCTVGLNYCISNISSGTA